MARRCATVGVVDAPFPDLAVVAEGSLPTGERWIVTAGGTSDNYYSFLKTVHPDGHWDEGGMGGSVLYAGQVLPQNPALSAIEAFDAAGQPRPG